MAKKTIELRPDYAARAIRMFISDSKITNHRYRSWEHCYLAFKEAREKKTPESTPDYDYLSLHLACYLSSWGMLRNSFLLERDYRTHLDIVELLLSDSDEKLWTFPKQQPNQDDNEKVLQSYWSTIDSIRQKFTKKYKMGKEVTETLTSKILLGTCACIPAIDRFYKAGVSMAGGTQRLGKNSYSEVVRYYWTNWDSISNHLGTCNLVTDPSTPFPPMKLMDMCFWQIGACIDRYDKKYYDEEKKEGKRFFDLKTKKEQYNALDEFLMKMENDVN